MSSTTEDGKSSRYYLGQIKDKLPANCFDREPKRALWIATHIALVLSCCFLAMQQPAWYWQAALVILIGHSYGCLMFVGHELMHGSIVRPGKWQYFLATLCFLPYCITPKQWFTWHNSWHHKWTTASGFDPDSWGNIDTYNRRKEFRFVERLSPGSGRWYRLAFFGYWFTAQGILVMLVFSRLFHYWSDAERRRIWTHIAMCVVFWGVVGVSVGWQVFLVVYLLPMVIANGVQMAYIATNHLLMPETRHVNDPLANSLSVKTWPIFDWLHLNFSHHVEHHVAPSMSPRHAPTVRRLLEKQFPERYRRINHTRALRLLYQTPQVHWDSQHLVNPHTGKTYSTIGKDCDVAFIGTLPLPVPRPTKDQPLPPILTP